MCSGEEVLVTDIFLVVTQKIPRPLLATLICIKVPAPAFKSSPDQKNKSPGAMHSGFIIF